MARIVIATFGSYGDLHPFLALAQGLQARGHRPVLATSPAYRPQVEEAGIEFAPMRPDLDDFGPRAEVMRRASDLRNGSKYVITELILPNLRTSHADLSRAVEGADLLVNQMLAFAGPIVAEQQGLPWVSTALTPMALSSQDDPPIYPQAPFLHKVHRVSPQLYRGLFRMAKRTLGNWSQPVYAFRQELGLPPPVGDPLLEGQFSPTMTLALFSRLLAQPQADWPPRTRVTGFPFHDSQTGDEKVADELRAFVETHGPPLVFTLGSTAVHDAGDFYTVSAQAAHALQRPALLITGPDPRNRPTRLNDSTLALEYVPYNWVFQHAAVVVHQGGIGTTGQAMRAARPMLVVPFSHDQPDNAYRVAALGIAATLPRRKYTAATAAKALRPLLDNPAFARRAAEVGHEIAQEDGVAAACVALEEAFTLGSSNRRAAPSAIQPA